MIRAISIMTACICLILAMPATSSAGVFGDVSVAFGGTYPQGDFTTYADPGFTIDLRGTMRFSESAAVALWGGLSFVLFDHDVQTTHRRIELENDVVIFNPVEQTTDQMLIAGHAGLRLAAPTQGGFFRPRAAVGVGVYHFRHDITWEEHVDGESYQLAYDNLDNQTKFGWRGRIGADFFILSEVGITADFVYDYVFNLEQEEGPSLPTREVDADFNGFSVGLIWLFSL